MPNSLTPGRKTTFQQTYIGRYIVAFTYCKIYHTWKVSDETTTDPEAVAGFEPTAPGEINLTNHSAQNNHTNHTRILIDHVHSSGGAIIDNEVEWVQKYLKHQDCKEYGYKVISIDVKKDEKVDAGNLDDYCSNKYTDEARITLLSDVSVLSTNKSNYPRERLQNIRPTVQASTIQLKSKTTDDQVYTGYAIIVSHGVCRDKANPNVQTICYEIYNDKVINLWAKHRVDNSANTRPTLHKLGNLGEIVGGKPIDRADGQIQVLKNKSGHKSNVPGERSYSIHEDRLLVIYKELVDAR